MGSWLGQELRQIQSYQDFSAVVPVPIHPQKLRLRGYNQAAIFGRALAHSLDIPCLETLLIQTEIRQTQAKQGRWERWSKKQSFALNPEYHPLMTSLRTRLVDQSPQNHQNKIPHAYDDHNHAFQLRQMNLLLVDDVITTGATIEACGSILIRELGASLSCASIAIA